MEDDTMVKQVSNVMHGDSCDKKAWQGHGLAHWRGGGYHHNLAFSEAVRVFDVRQRLDRFPA